MLSTLTAALLLTTTARAEAFLDGAFTSALCQAWNDSAMPGLVGRNGSGWIDSAGSEGRQVIVMGRRDCAAWPKAALVIEADAAGDAVCVKGGVHGGTAFQWKFEPTTPQWADFTDGFGVMDMPGIMSGFVGPYGVAANNIGSFEVFFAVTGKLAFDRSVDWDCEGGDPDKIAKAVDKVDLDRTAKILH
ncbi:MAG: hypothetical protein D6798_07230 [Deltaproteobacteria bacterium]|nr:MAG: hypothetical protein D6798_07230 [Deltaproteobacteria bacterium]